MTWILLREDKISDCSFLNTSLGLLFSFRFETINANSFDLLKNFRKEKEFNGFKY